MAAARIAMAEGRIEDELRERGKKLGEAGLEELDQIWNTVKLKTVEGPA